MQPSEAVFFLGAGASVPAGVPDTYSFVTDYESSIRDPNKKRTIQKIIQTLKKWKKSEIDIELLLETLTKLDAKEQEPLLEFFEGKKFILSGYHSKKKLIEDLKDFIKSKAIVSEEKILYLEPILGFVEQFRPLDIVSVNYDTCLEHFCYVNKLALQDGFDVNWNPKLFDSELKDVRLYKLHGSVTWYQSDRGGYIKLPILTKKSVVELFTREKAENLMLYPMQKWDYAEPLLELLVEMKHLLESETCNFLIVVGYSFRDDHIRRILWDVARKNKKLIYIIIDPNAYHIYVNKLKYYDDQHKIPSSLIGRVVCLPYRFEKVFPFIKNYYYKNLKEGIINETEQHRAEIIEGKKANWMACVTPFVNAEYCEKIESLIESRIDNFELEKDVRKNLELLVKMVVNFSANNQDAQATLYLKKLKKYLRTIFIEKFYVDVPRETAFPGIAFFATLNGRSYTSAQLIKEYIENLFDFCTQRLDWVQDKTPALLTVTRMLGDLNTYLDLLVKNEREEFGAYIPIRSEKIENAVECREKFHNKVLDTDTLKEEYRTLIETIEKSILTEIIE